MRWVNVLYKVEEGNLHAYKIVQVDGRKLKEPMETIEPYFYTKVEVSHHLILQSEILDVENGRFFKHYCKLPFQVKEVREELKLQKIETFEADILYSRRLFIDTITDVGSELLNKVYFDIECDNPATRFADATKDRLKSIALVAKDFKWVQHISEAGSERALILNFIKQAYNYSCLVGWNCDMFDIPYLIERCKRVGIPIDWVNHFCVLDLMSLYKRFVNSYSKGKVVSSFSLGNVANLELGEAKEDKRVLFEQDIEKIKSYNLHDTELCMLIDDKTKLVELIDAFSRISNLLPEDCVHFSRIMTFMIIRMLHNKYVFNNTPDYGTQVEKFEGALVLEPPVGMFRGVAVFDFSSMYPNIIRDFGISIDKGGTFGKLVDMFMTLRKDYKSKWLATKDETYYVLQVGCKFLLASFYGVIGFPMSRIYNKELAAKVTATGRQLITVAKEFSELNEFKVLYGDTDSIMLQIPLERCKSHVIALNAHLNSKFKLTHTSMSYEKYFDKVVFYGTKKRYFGLIVEEEGAPCHKVFVRGLEVRRTDWSAMAKEYEQHLLDLIVEKGLKEAQAYHNEFVKHISGRPIEDYAIYKSVTKPISEYKIVPVHARLFNESNFIGEKIGFVVTRFKKKIEEVKSVNESGLVPDSRYYLNKQILPIYERVLAPLIEGLNQRKLSDFYG